MNSSEPTASLEPLALIQGPAFVSMQEPGSNMAAIMAARAEKYGAELHTEIDIYGVEKSMPISSLYEHALRLIPKLGAGDPSAVVVLCIESVLDYVPAAWACIFSGRTFLSWTYNEVSARSEQTRTRLDYLGHTLDQPVLMTTRAVNDRLQLQEAGAFSSVIFIEDVTPPHEAGSQFADPLIAPDHLADLVNGSAGAFLTQTSGSSGTPKLVEISFERMLNRWFLNHQESDGNRYWVSPLDSAFGPLYTLFPKPGGLVYIAPERAFAEPLDLLRVVEKHRIEFLGSSNSFFASLIAALDQQPFEGDVSCLRSMCFSGETITHEVATGIREQLRALGAPGVEVCFRYGSSEVGAVAMICTNELDPNSTGSADSAPVPQGPPSPGNEVRIVDESGTVLRYGDIGHIEIRSESRMFSGYYADPDATGLAFTDDGWFRSGDLGYIDQVGVRIVGRENGMIITNGRNISLAQIDVHLFDLPSIRQHLVASAAVRTAQTTTEELAVFFVPSVDSTAGLSQVCRDVKQQVAQNCGISAKTLNRSSRTGLRPNSHRQG